ncbi:MAG: acyl-CoA thioesterase [Pseudohongiellaceae bacterium]|jgi:acyl-CoA thioesterase
MSDSNLHEILSALNDSDNNTANFDELWSQGRSAFGGLAASFATNAMAKLLSSPQPIRSLMVSFIGPLPPGDANVDAKILRQGKNVTQMSANVSGNDKLCLQAMGVFGNPRAGISVPSNYPFDPVSRNKGIPFETAHERMPPFLQFFEGYWVSEGLPYSGNPTRYLNMWVRHKVDMSDHPIEKMVTIADIPPPLILSHFTEAPVPTSSLTWALEFVIPPEEIDSQWFYLEFLIESAANGYTQQSGRIFAEDGRLCALSRQCMVYFG